MTMINNGLLIQQLSEYMKLVEITIVLLRGFMEDEHIFSIFGFMKDKLHNRLGYHLNTIVYMFTHKFFIQNSFPY